MAEIKEFYEKYKDSELAHDLNSKIGGYIEQKIHIYTKSTNPQYQNLMREIEFVYIDQSGKIICGSSSTSLPDIGCEHSPTYKERAFLAFLLGKTLDKYDTEILISKYGDEGPSVYPHIFLKPEVIEELKSFIRPETIPKKIF